MSELIKLIELTNKGAKLDAELAYVEASLEWANKYETLQDEYIALQKQFIEYAEQSKWTPIEKGLPKETGQYMVTDEKDWVGQMTFICETDNSFFFPYSLDKVIAWMNLPQPYQAEKEEKK